MRHDYTYVYITSVIAFNVILVKLHFCVKPFRSVLLTLWRAMKHAIHWWHYIQNTLANSTILLRYRVTQLDYIINN